MSRRQNNVGRDEGASADVSTGADEGGSVRISIGSGGVSVDDTCSKFQLRDGGGSVEDCRGGWEEGRYGGDVDSKVVGDGAVAFVSGTCLLDV